MTASATTTTKKKTASHMPPREIRDNTKARRAWLTEKLAEISAKPNTIAKIVGTGSYQEVSEWTVTEVEGRLRHRGHCQVCGRKQVVQDGQLVLHGYKRPGTGEIYNTCPGENHAPLNVTDKLTQSILADLLRQQTRATKRVETTRARLDKAIKARQSDMTLVEADASREFPRLPNKWSHQKHDAATLAAHEGAMAVWAAKFPIAAEYHEASQTHSAAEHGLSSVKMAVSFYRDLLGMKITGTPLTPEVVR